MLIVKKQFSNLLLEGVGNQEVYILPLIQQQHGTEVANPLVCEAWGRHQLQTLQLSPTYIIHCHHTSKLLPSVSLPTLNVTIK